jgi:hypothetical protein
MTAVLVACTAPTAMINYIHFTTAGFRLWRGAEWDLWWVALKHSALEAFSRPWVSEVSIGVNAVGMPVMFHNPTGRPIPEWAAKMLIQLNLIYLTIPAIIPSLLLLVQLAATIGVALLRPLLHRPIEWILQCLEEHNLGVLTLLAAMFLFVAGFLKVLP